MISNKVVEIKNEVNKVIAGKDEVIEKTLMAILAGGHILLEDIPGVGKTTMALTFSKAMGLDFKRVQFTPDVVPSDITGFTMYDKNTGAFSYRPGAVMCNLFLADEINRTSSKTQSALLEVMQEGKVTVDGEVHNIEEPFIVLATQNPIGTAGTQMLPEAQLDRFMVKLSMGYPSIDAQIEILKDREKTDPINYVRKVVSKEEVIGMKEAVSDVFVDEKIYKYIALLVEDTRNNEYIKLGISPRGALAISNMAKACAYIRGREYAVPEDIEEVFKDVSNHRLIMKSKAQVAEVTKDMIMDQVLAKNEAPKLDSKV